MTGFPVAQIVVTVLGVAAIGGVIWYFLLSRGTPVAAVVQTADGPQEVHVMVKGGYEPDTIVVEAGKPVRLLFYRDETADCSERVVFEAFGVSQALPAFRTTPVEFTPHDPGEFEFRCGMNMLKGRLVVYPPGVAPRPTDSPHRDHA
jgi:P-type Cu+ transporter